MDHCYIYQLGSGFDYLFHTEDRYVFSCLPAKAHIIAHADIEYDLSEGGWDRKFIWETRASNFNEHDKEVLRSGGFSDALIDLLTGEDTDEE